MKKFPKESTPEYYALIDRVCLLLTSHLYIEVYGFTGYNLGFHWIDSEVSTYRSNAPQSIHVKTAIKILDKIGVAGDLVEYVKDVSSE